MQLFNLNKNKWINEGRYRSGFTLLEVIVVVAIIGVISVIAVPNFRRMRANANIFRAKGDLEMLKTAVEFYMVHQDPAKYPATTDQLWQVFLKDATPRIVEKALYDPFRSGDEEYRYVRSDNGAYYALWSYGIDEASSITGIGDDGVITPADRGDDIYASNGSTQ